MNENDEKGIKGNALPLILSGIFPPLGLTIGLAFYHRKDFCQGNAYMAMAVITTVSYCLLGLMV